MSRDAERRATEYKQENDRSLLVNQEIDERQVNPNPLFRAGRSNRVWGELYKVLDSSDVVVEVIDARDPEGTRCKHIEEFLRKEKPHKHLILLMNKVDLVGDHSNPMIGVLYEHNWSMKLMIVVRLGSDLGHGKRWLMFSVFAILEEMAGYVVEGVAHNRFPRVHSTQFRQGFPDKCS